MTKRAGISSSGSIKPERRVVAHVDNDGREELYIIELRQRTLTMRPYRKQSGTVTVTWGSIYRRALLAQAADEQRETKPRRRVSRSLLRGR